MAARLPPIDPAAHNMWVAAQPLERQVRLIVYEAFGATPTGQDQ